MESFLIIVVGVVGRVYVICAHQVERKEFQLNACLPPDLFGRWSNPFAASLEVLRLPSKISLIFMD